ncbi:MAG TPA: hypothetical protein ENI22_00300 [Candidatus Pacearchaeota archaeon]|nr:hypothetical protein [Candidatus Pacearchaeota archaeon]
MPTSRKDVRDIIREYGNKLDNKISTTRTKDVNYSREYVRFKQEMAPDLSRFERWAKSLGSVVKLKVSQKDESKIKKHLEAANLDLEPWQALTLSVMVFLSVFFLGIFISLAFVLIKADFGAFPFLFFFLMVLLSFFLYYFMRGYPERLASKWRLKASSQMVPTILYVVVYMRHTPNLERAIAFAAEHLQYPLALDLKKVFYDVQVGKFSTIKESLDHYLETWRGYSTEFIEAFHLIESSLYEPDNSRRILTLEKALHVVLDGVHDKMLQFTHTVKSPLTNVYMLGVVLPTLGLALLPLATAMLGGMITWIHVFILFNLIVPFFVFYLTDRVIFLRPGGYGESSLLERNPLYPKYKSKKPYVTAFLITLPFLILGLLPFIFQYTPIPGALGLPNDFTFSELGLGFFGEGKFFDFVSTENGTTGPFGVGALILGMFIPLGAALFFSISYKLRTKELILERNKTRQLESEFNNSLFQIGNRVGSGVPPELVFGKVAESSHGLRTEDFFMRVNYNIRQMGMSVEKAIFDPKRGAIIFYPSDLIATSMRILVESSKKGLKVAAISMMSISEYIKNIGKITSRLRDMLAEVISDMRSNMSFLAPLLSGVVVGLAAMITSILTKLNLSEAEGAGTAALGNLGTITDLFEVTKMIPPYFLQIIVGFYLIQIIFILTRTLVTIDAGEDKLERTNKTGKNLMKGMMLFFFTALFATLSLFVLTNVVLGNLG